MKPLLETIDTRFGTASKHAFSRGNTLPYTGVPFGMNYFVPQTSDQEGSWFFDPHLPIFQGIRLTHQPSPWIGDYSWLLLTPVTGQLGGDSLFHRQSSYDRDKASFQPHYLKIFSLRYQIETQLTPTCYGASIRLEQKQDKALSLYLHTADELTVEQVDKRTLALRQEGKTETNKNPLIMFTAFTDSSSSHRLFMRLINQGKPSTWIWQLVLSNPVYSLATMASGIPSAPPSPSLPLSYQSIIVSF